MSEEFAPVASVVAGELRSALARRRWSHADLARAGNLAQSSVNRSLRGTSAITIDQYVAMLVALEPPGSDPDEVEREVVALLVREVRRRTSAAHHVRMAP